MIPITGLLAIALPLTVWLFLRHIERLNKSHEARTSELLTRIQHPEIVRPEPMERTEPPAPVFNDDIHLVGTIQNGKVDTDE